MEKKLSRVRTAVIPVAGRGTRFAPITRAVPKELLPLVDTPTLQYILLEAVQAGIETVVLVTSRGKGAIEDFFDSESLDESLRGLRIISVRQPEPRGLGHAILCAQPAVKNEPFAVLLGDDVIDGEVSCTKQLIDIFEKMQGDPVVGVMEVPANEVKKYGIVGGQKIKDDLLLVDRLVEKPDPDQAPSRFAIPGRYILTPDIFDLLAQTAPSIGGEIQLTDALAALAKKRKMYAFRFAGTRYDAGDRVGYLKANIHFALKRPELRPQLLAWLKELVEKK